MKRKGLVIFMMVMASLMSSCTNKATVKISVDIKKTYQTMEGFGTSGGWWSQDVGGWKEIDPILDYLFDVKKGIGLNIYRYNIGAGLKNESTDPWRVTETFEIAPGKYDFTKDANSVKAMEGAVSRGVDTVYIFANSPTGRMTKSGYTSGDFNGSSNLKTGMEKDFAKYLVDISEYFKKDGIPVKYISPINEPQWDWKPEKNQEGCHYSFDEIMNVSKALVEELKNRGSDIKPSFIDSGKWYDADYTFKLYNMMTSDPEVGPSMDHFAAHSYWTSDSDKKLVANILSKEPKKLPLHMTEWCEMESGRDLGMDSALVLAKTVHEDLTILSATSWTNWIAVSCYDYKDGLIYVDKDTHKYYETKKMWALGNYSRFIRTNYKRIDVKCDERSLLTSGFISPDSSRLVVVVVNTGNENSIDLDNISYKKVSRYETSNTNSLKEIYNGSLKKSYNIPSKSVTTFVFE